MGDLDAFRKISKSVGASQATEMFDQCGILASAAKINGSMMLSEVLNGTESEPANPDGGRLTVRLSNTVDQISVVFWGCAELMKWSGYRI